MVGVRGMPERDIESLGVMGKGAGRGQEILPPSPPPPSSSSPSESGCLVIIVFLRFLTHMRDLDALLPGNCSQFRCGSFLFSKNRDFSKTSRNTLQKISEDSEKCFFLIANIEANRE